MQGDVPQVVVGQKARKLVRAHHQGRRDLDLDVREEMPDLEPRQKEAQKTDAPGLAAERPLPHPHELDRVRVAAGEKMADDVALFLVEHRVDHPDQKGAQILGLLEVLHPFRVELLGDLDFGAGHHPVGEVLLPRVVQDGLDRHLPQPLHQFARVAGPGDLGPRRGAEDEIAEAHVFPQEPLQVFGQPGGVLVDELGRKRKRPRPVFLRLRTLDADRQPALLLLQHPHEIEAGLVVHAALARKAHVADHPQDVGLVAPVERHGLLVAVRQHDLGP